MQSKDKIECVKFLDGDWKMTSIDFPKLEPNQVLIKVQFTTCLPYDKTIKETSKQEGFCMGTEGCGTIVDLGDSVPKDFMDKKVAFFGDAWSTFVIKDFENLIIFDHNIDLKEVSNAFVNPLTACALLDFSLNLKVKSVILTAATSATGMMFLKLAQKEGLEVISIVKDDKCVNFLKQELNAKYVFNEYSDNFKDDMQGIIKMLGPTLLFDLIGGDIPPTILSLMPEKSLMLVIGNLSEEPLKINPNDIMIDQKELKGFFLPNWLKTLNKDQKMKWFDLIANDFNKGGFIFKEKIAKTMKLTDWKQIIDQSKGLVEKGKIQIEVL